MIVVKIKGMLHWLGTAGSSAPKAEKSRGTGGERRSSFTMCGISGKVLVLAKARVFKPFSNSVPGAGMETEHLPLEADGSGADMVSPMSAPEPSVSSSRLI